MEKVRWGAWRLGADFILHPLIYTRVEFKLAQDIENRQAIVGIKKPPLTRTASRGFRAARMEHTSP